MKKITIVGGGLAGLSLGLALRRLQVPVLLFEAGKYPRHRVCGEFISGRGRQVLDHLGLSPELFRRGAQEARTVRIFIGNRATPARQLPRQALSVSRWVLDTVLAEAFEAAGGELRTGFRWAGSWDEPGTVRATGRQTSSQATKWRWFGLKAHARGVRLNADLEMHLRDNGYVGLSRLAEDEVNVCGLFRRHIAEPMSAGSREEILRGPMGQSLREKLKDAEFDGSSFCSVAGLDLEPKIGAGRTDCCIGDALTMTPPVTGNGMSMAFEASDLAAGRLEEYSRGKLSWEECRTSVAALCDRAFASRLGWARQLHRLLFAPMVRSWIIPKVIGWEPAWRLGFERTR